MHYIWLEAEFLQILETGQMKPGLDTTMCRKWFRYFQSIFGRTLEWNTWLGICIGQSFPVPSTQMFSQWRHSWGIDSKASPAYVDEAQQCVLAWPLPAIYTVWFLSLCICSIFCILSPTQHKLQLPVTPLTWRLPSALHLCCVLVISPTSVSHSLMGLGNFLLVSVVWTFEHL